MNNKHLKLVNVNRLAVPKSTSTSVTAILDEMGIALANLAAEDLSPELLAQLYAISFKVTAISNHLKASNLHNRTVQLRLV